MQNTSRAHRMRLLVLAALVIGVAALALIAAPTPSLAKSYSVPHVDIAAEVTESGDLDVTEQRRFDFDGSFTCVWWDFGNLPVNGSMQVNGVQLQQGSSSEVTDISPHAISEVPFQTPWRSAGGPGGEAWSWDEGENTLYVFFSATDENLVVSIDYTVQGAVAGYSDVDELYWQYIGEGWSVDSKNVNLAVSLPVPAGQAIEAAQNVYAWGHGPLDGSVHFDDDGTISYSSPTVPAGQYAEARILFPAEWTPGIRAENLHSSERLDTVLAQEQNWADAANSQRTQARIFIAIWFVIAAALIAWALVMFFRYGKERKPEFTDKYWRDVPDKFLSPAVVSRLVNWNSEHANQFTATLMGLSAKGVLRIDKGGYQDRRGRPVEDYYLTLLPDALAQTQVDNLERKAINLIFGDIAKGGNQLWFKSIELYGKDHPEKFAKKMESWQGALTGEVSKAKLFEPKSDTMQVAMRVVAGAYVLLSLGMFWLIENAWTLAPVVPTCIVLLIIAHFMSKRTQRGADVAAKSEALKRWLKDFTRLDERPPTDVKVWGQFMVYAFLFGIADQVVRDLRMHVPTFRDMDDATFYNTMPYYYWYSSDMGASHALAASVFDATLSNTISTAVAAISEMSDGGGGGGGFSGGGGGGFGGGGGGGAR